MKDTIKNSIVGGLAIFGLVSLISSSITPTPIHEGSNGTPESHVWSAISTSATTGNLSYVVIYNKKTGEARVPTRNHGGIGKIIKFQ